MGELDRYTEVHDTVLPKVDNEYTEACVFEGEEVLTLRPKNEEHRNSSLSQKNPLVNWEPPLLNEDWVVLCQALYQSIGEEEWTEVHGKVQEAYRKNE